MSLRSLVNMDRNDPGFLQAVKDFAADLQPMSSGFLYRVISQMDNRGLRRLQEEALSVSGERLLESDKARSLAESAPPPAGHLAAATSSAADVAGTSGGDAADALATAARRLRASWRPLSRGTLLPPFVGPSGFGPPENLPDKSVDDSTQALWQWRV